MASLTAISKALVSQGRPDGLWLRYAATLLLVLLTLGTAQLTGHLALQKSLSDSHLLRAAHRVERLLDDTLHDASATARGQSASVALEASLAVFATEMRALREALASERTTFFGLDDPFQPLASDLSIFTSVGRALAADGSDDGLRRELERLGRGPVSTKIQAGLASLDDQIAERHAFLARFQIACWLIAALLLVVEVALVVLPTQLAASRALRGREDTETALRFRTRELAEAKEALERAASHDALTKLPNRAYLIDRLAETLQQGATGHNLLMIDIDKFRAINDSAGQTVGDALIVMVARLLRDFAGPGDVVARIGGDEFALLTRSEPEAIARQLRRRFEKPVTVAGRPCHAGLSIGYVVLRRWDRDALTVLSNGEMAVYHAKREESGRGIAAYSRRLREEVMLQDRLAAAIPEAMATEQIVPYYQPQVNLVDGTISGCEVLVRWKHPERGLIAPNRFLDLAAGAGLARDLDHHVWTLALRDLSEWRKTGLRLPRLSLNAAPETMTDPGLLDSLGRMLLDSETSTANVAIEVLETTFIGDGSDAASLNIDRLTAAGLTVELDDFGTGYTSLSTLIQTSLGGIKLDRSLVAPLPARSAQSVLRAVIALSGEMNLHVLAEGIETAEQADYLADIGCTYGQGFAFGKPMPAAEFRDWARLWTQGDTESGVTRRRA